jgi:hypothetical protein
VTQHEQLHAYDFKAWCDSLDSRFRSDGFSTMSECENTMKAFTVISTRLRQTHNKKRDR